mgnify:CR=1 FL=1
MNRAPGEWYDKAVNLRSTGLPYEAIGAIVGVTRERVRQVLKKLSPDLTGYYVEPVVARRDAATAQRRSENWARHCVGCGTPFVGGRASQKFCAPGCCARGYVDARVRAEKIIELRRSGHTWDECGKAVGVTGQRGAQAQSCAVRYADVRGLDIYELTGMRRNQKAKYRRASRSERVLTASAAPWVEI